MNGLDKTKVTVTYGDGTAASTDAKDISFTFGKGDTAVTVTGADDEGEAGHSGGKIITLNDTKYHVKYTSGTGLTISTVTKGEGNKDVKGTELMTIGTPVAATASKTKGTLTGTIAVDSIKYNDPTSSLKATVGDDLDLKSNNSLKATSKNSQFANFQSL